jgi:hypothetical protein
MVASTAIIVVVVGYDCFDQRIFLTQLLLSYYYYSTDGESILRSYCTSTVYPTHYVQCINCCCRYCYRSSAFTTVVSSFLFDSSCFGMAIQYTHPWTLLTTHILLTHSWNPKTAAVAAAFWERTQTLLEGRPRRLSFSLQTNECITPATVLGSVVLVQVLTRLSSQDRHSGKNVNGRLIHEWNGLIVDSLGKKDSDTCATARHELFVWVWIPSFPPPLSRRMIPPSFPPSFTPRH